MAVSKTQNERPAITALIDAVNMAEPIVAQNVQNIETLTDNLDIEISNRENADADIQSQIGSGVFSPSFNITQAFQQVGVMLLNISDTLDEWKNRFRLGLTESVTVAASGSASGTLYFETPFDIDDAEVAVFLVCVDSSGNFTDLACKLISANYLGFSFNVYNSTQASVTTKVGFLAVKVN